MEIHGKLNLVDSQVTSEEFANDNQFNKLIVNDLSEVDQSTLDHKTVIFNKSDDRFYTYNVGYDSWVSTEFEINSNYDLQYSEFLFIDDVKDLYNIVNLSDATKLTVDKELFNFGPIGSPVNFVIDFWLRPDALYSEGTLLYNGLKTGQVDLDINQNLLISTDSGKLIKDPHYQVDPTVSQSIEWLAGHINIMRPQLSSTINISQYHLLHVAMIRSGDITYLAINGNIEDSAPSVEYFHYDDVQIGHGYIDDTIRNQVSYGLINLRVSKNTDLGWTTNFTPPNFAPIADSNTKFLMDSTSLVDTTGNYSIDVDGDTPVISQDRFYYQLPQGYNGCVISTHLIQEKLVLQLPLDNVDVIYYIITNDTPIEIITNYDSNYRHSVESLNFTIPPNTSHSFYQTAKIIIPRPNITPVIRDKFCMNLPGFRDAIFVKNGVMVHHRDDNIDIAIPYFSMRARSNNAQRFQNNMIPYDFSSTSSQYYSDETRYPKIHNFGDQLLIWDCLMYLKANTFQVLAGEHSNSSGWDLYGYSGTYDLRFYGATTWVIRQWEQSAIGDYVHVIFSYYRGKMQAHTLSVNRDSSYHVLTTEIADSAYGHTIARYMPSGTNNQFVFVRHRLIDEELTTDQITNYIQQAYLI